MQNFSQQRYGNKRSNGTQNNLGNPMQGRRGQHFGGQQPRGRQQQGQEWQQSLRRDEMEREGPTGNGWDRDENRQLEPGQSMPPRGYGYGPHERSRDWPDAGEERYGRDFDRDDEPGYRGYGHGAGWGNSGDQTTGRMYGSSGFGNDRNPYAGQGTTEQKFARGPKGYKRSDERIKEDVCDRIWHMGNVDASDVEVSVSNGEVTLTGTVRDRGAKWQLESMIEMIGGVNDVHNQLRMKRDEEPSSSKRTGSTPTQK
ncbi:MAG: BON domain-containing protein [Myxococcaceae bacterium]|nr:BON domain-containing protein [Myxococcaceae bacterium]